MASFLLFLWLTTINFHLLFASNTSYTCDAGKDCILTFDSFEDASESSIECPSDYSCSITCADSSASTPFYICKNLFIDASLSTSLSLTCIGDENCQNIDVLAATENTTIECDGSNACSMAQFDFQSTSYVSISCNSEDSCSYAKFYGQDTFEMNFNFNAINAANHAQIFCGFMCFYQTSYEQSNISIYSKQRMFGQDIMQCTNNENECYLDSRIYCKSNYSTTCGIQTAENGLYCDECLNDYSFEQYVLEFSVKYETNVDTIRHRQLLQNIFYDSLIYLLSDPIDAYRQNIQNSADCNDCIDSISNFINIQILDESITQSNTYSMSIQLSTNLNIINQQMTKALNDIRFELILNTNMIKYDDSFITSSINLPKESCVNSPSSNDRQISLAITILLVIILTIVFLLALIGTIQMYKYDVTIYVTGILLFGLYCWDFYSDILFSWEVYNYFAICNDNLMLILFILCLVFLILPIVASIWSLFRFQDKWTEDPAIGDRVTGWNRDWSTYLLMATILSGSSFAAVNILNSRVFGHPIFCMGLSYRHLKKFENQRLWGVILSENVPQLVIQMIFFVGSGTQFSGVLILATVSSLLSIIVAAIDIYNNKRLFGQFSDSDDYQTILKVPVISPEVSENQWKLCLATHRFNEVFSKIIGVDKYAIEVDLPLPDNNGLIINFSVRTTDISPRDIMNSMNTAQRNGAMAKFIQEAWKLNDAPLLGRIKYDLIGRKDELEVEMQTAENLNPLSNDAKTLQDVGNEAGGTKMVNSAISISSIPEYRNNGRPRKRSNTIESKPYDQVDKTTKYKMKRKVMFKDENVTSPSSKLQTLPSESVYDEDNLTVVEHMSEYGDVPSNVQQSQIQMQNMSKSGPLPRQRTGAHTKALSEYAIKNKGANALVDLAAQGGRLSTSVSTSPMSERGAYRKQQVAMKQQKHAQSSIRLKNYNSHSGIQRKNKPPPPSLHHQSHSMYQKPPPPAHGHGHGHAQTYAQIPYNYQQMQQQPNGPGVGMNPQQQYQQYMMQPMHAQSQHNMHQNMYNQQQLQQQQQQQYVNAMQQMQNQRGWKSMTNMNQNQNMQYQNGMNGQNVDGHVEDDDHASFVPPTPQQDMQRLKEWKSKRKLMDQQKKQQKRQQQQQRGHNNEEESDDW